MGCVRACSVRERFPVAWLWPVVAGCRCSALFSTGAVLEFASDGLDASGDGVGACRLSSRAACVAPICRDASDATRPDCGAPCPCPIYPRSILARLGCGALRGATCGDAVCGAKLRAGAAKCGDAAICGAAKCGAAKCGAGAAICGAAKCGAGAAKCGAAIAGCGAAGAPGRPRCAIASPLKLAATNRIVVTAIG